MRKILVGDIVTTSKKHEAFYSRYKVWTEPFQLPECYFEPRMEGVVCAVHVPAVRNTTGHTEYLCIRFVHPTLVYNRAGKTDEEKRTWDCALYYDEVMLVRRNNG